LLNISFIQYFRRRSLNSITFNLIANQEANYLKENKPAFDIIDINRNALVVAKTALKLGSL